MTIATPPAVLARLDALEQEWRRRVHAIGRDVGSYTQCADDLATLRAALNHAPPTSGEESLPSWRSGSATDPRGYNDGSGRIRDWRTPAGESGAEPCYCRRCHPKLGDPSADAPATAPCQPRAAAQEVLALYAEEITERGPWVSYADFCRLTQPSGAVEGVPLPELPEPAGHSGIPAFSEFYTAEQMREYARAARLARGGSHD